MCEDPSWRGSGAGPDLGNRSILRSTESGKAARNSPAKNGQHLVGGYCRAYLHCCTETPRTFSVTHCWLALQTWNPQSAAFGVLELPGSGMGRDPVGNFTPGIEGRLILGT